MAMKKKTQNMHNYSKLKIKDSTNTAEHFMKWSEMQNERSECHTKTIYISAIECKIEIRGLYNMQVRIVVKNTSKTTHTSRKISFAYF